MNGQEALTEAATVPQLLLGIGSVFLAALVLEAIGRRLHVPRVTLLILFGALVGPPVLDWLPPGLDGSGEIFAPTALTMVAFLLGSTLRRDTLRAPWQGDLRDLDHRGSRVVPSGAGGLTLLGVPLAMALLLGGHLLGHRSGGDPRRDAPVRGDGTLRRQPSRPSSPSMMPGGFWSSPFMLTIAGVLVGAGEGNHLLDGLHEGGGAVLLGLAIGLPAAVDDRPAEARRAEPR